MVRGQMGRRHGSASAKVGSAPASGQATLWVIWARWIYIEIYNLHAALPLDMAGTDQPWSVTELSVADLGQEETTPLACPRQTRRAFAADLIGQGFLLPLRVAEDDWAQLARPAYVQTIRFRVRIACSNKL
jgi:hypothetical protein